MSQDDVALLRELGFDGDARKLRAALRFTGLMLTLAGALMLMKHFGWWPNEPRLWTALAMMALGIVALTIVRNPPAWMKGER